MSYSQLLEVGERDIGSFPKDAFAELIMSHVTNDGFFRTASYLLQERARTLAVTLDESKLEAKMFELAGEEFNPRSPKHLSTILFEKLGLPVVRKTATGYSTDAGVLEELAVKHPLPAVVLEHRSFAKLKRKKPRDLPLYRSQARRH